MTKPTPDPYAAYVALFIGLLVIGFTAYLVITYSQPAQPPCLSYLPCH